LTTAALPAAEALALEGLIAPTAGGIASRVLAIMGRPCSSVAGGLSQVSDAADRARLTACAALWS